MSAVANQLPSVTGTTWIVVADAEHARFFTLSADHQHLREIDTIKSHGGHHVETHTPFHNKLAERFARDIAELLVSAARRAQFDHLALIAGPRFIGELQEALPPALRSRVVAEVHKDLVRHPVPDIRAHLPGFITAMPPAIAFARNS